MPDKSVVVGLLNMISVGSFIGTVSDSFHFLVLILEAVICSFFRRVLTFFNLTLQ